MLVTAGCRANCEWPGKIIASYAIASEAATASTSRDQARGAERPLNPRALDDRFIAQILQSAGESAAIREKCSPGSRALLGRQIARKWQNNG
jgi:hypothetical protein